MTDRGHRVDPVAELRSGIEAAAAAAAEEVAEAPSVPSLSRPPEPKMGDYSSNAAMILAGAAGSNPRELAAEIAAALGDSLGPSLERVEVAGPGFLNLHLSDRWFRDALTALTAAIADAPSVSRAFGDAVAEFDDPLYGLGPIPTESARRYLVEFVSANPTGPLTAASGRHAAYGDSICRLLEALGHEVHREYYVNDAGGQIARFAQSIAAEMTGSPPPEDGYRGDYIQRLADRFRAGGSIEAADLDAVGRAGVAEVRRWIAATLDGYGVRFDRWTSERDLHESGAVERAVTALTEAGRTYEAEGAIWLRTTEFGDDKDRVLIRGGGEPTYFAADVAYHAEKLGRGLDHLIDVFGADHHGYLGRMEAAIAALGAPPEAFEAQIMQMVSIVDGGQKTEMSKRSGNFVTLDELIAEIGIDATRFFMLQRSHETPFDLDLDLAKRQSSENPVYYVQYAHARIASILRKAGAAADSTEVEQTVLQAGLPPELGAGLEPAERDLIKRLLAFPDEVREAADRRAPHRICAYATEIASDFHTFYRDCKVIGAEGPGLEQFRMALCLAAKKTLAATLGLLGTEAPESM